MLFGHNFCQMYASELNFKTDISPKNGLKYANFKFKPSANFVEEPKKCKKCPYFDILGDR